MENFSRRETALSLAWLLLWIALGVFGLYAHNLVLPYIFLMYSALNCFAHLYLSCTRCSFFGRPCCLMGGMLSERFFKARHRGPMDPDDSISEALWLIQGVFPIPFLLYYQDWLMFAAYSALAYGWFYYRKKFICRKCGNEWCVKKK